jgi:queuine tRNA-ribosyltransferase
MSFRVVSTCPVTGARAGVLKTAHGDILTPAFMPVGTLATVKGLTPFDIANARAECVLANAYHLALRPGVEAIAALGGLHRFMGWPGPILTDSGGFQVHSLARLRRIDEAGVRFRSHLDGRELSLTPEKVIEMQGKLGSDLAVPLDVCLGPAARPDEAALALERTRRWATRSLRVPRPGTQQLFGIVQGSLDCKLRVEAARDLASLDFAGYAIGGLSVGEPPWVTRHLAAVTAGALPVERPRYLMGVGTPDQIVDYAAVGIDMFDSVLPTRLGRTGVAFGSTRRLNLKRPEFERDKRPIDTVCDCLTCGQYTRASLHSGIRQSSPIAARFISLHNVRALVRAAETARAAILAGRFRRPTTEGQPPTNDHPPPTTDHERLLISGSVSSSVARRRSSAVGRRPEALARA